MNLFEVGMLICFGAAWPFSIYRSLKSREVGGKSLVFLIVVFVGYLCGIFHKAFFHLDGVIVLYSLNAAMVLADICLYIRNRLYHVRRSLTDTGEAS